MNICMGTFRNMFEESGFEIYERREQITILVPQTDEQRGTDRYVLEDRGSGSREQVDG